VRLAQYAKENLTDLPYGVGALLAKVPYSLRPGIAKLYRSRRRELRELEAASTTARREFVFRRVKQVAEFAYENVPFYRDKYRAAGVYPSSFTSFADIASLPIVDKSELQAVPLEDRSSTRRGRSLVNTGGSSGEPLEFFIEPTSIPHEWAHMHEIWSRVGYRQSDLRLVFGGRSGITDGLRYDGARHQWNIDIQRGWEDIAERLCPILAGHKSIYLHGYPSSIFDFVVWAKDKAHPILPLLETRVRAMLLGSEAPAPSVRQTVERILGAESISWYGHTERAVLAGEALEPGQYNPYLSYH
jgi:phenylacetate-CoA ligase